MGEPYPTGESSIEPVSIADQPLFDAGEIESAIRERVEKYCGERLVKEIVDYMILSLIEVVMTKDPHPVRLERLDEDRQNTIKGLAPGVIAREDHSTD
jgi:hypothetical protein